MKLVLILICVLLLSGLVCSIKTSDRSKAHNKQIFRFVADELSRIRRSDSTLQSESESEQAPLPATATPTPAPVAASTVAPVAPKLPVQAEVAKVGDAAQSDPANVAKEGFLRMASEQMNDIGSYPDIPIEEGKVARLETLEGTINGNSVTTSTGIAKTALFRKNKKFIQGGVIPTVDAFYFRISGTNLYYTESSDDMIVLGAISVKNFQSTAESELDPICFTIRNSENDQWDLCAKDLQDKQNWIDAIQKAMGLPVADKTPNPTILVQQKIVQQPIILLPQPSPFCNAGWNFGRHGADWNCKCTEGSRQSPLDLKTTCSESISTPIDISFKPFKIASVGFNFNDNILKLKCAFEDENLCQPIIFAKLIDCEMNEFEAREIWFHTPADHQINSKIFDMEAQVIFYPAINGDFRKKAVLSFMIKSTPGAKNLFLDQFDILGLPNQVTKKTVVKSDFKNKGQESLNLEDIFKESILDTFQGHFSYYQYSGSLTAPPCDESVMWYVVDPPIEFSYSSLEMFKNVLDAPTAADMNNNPNAAFDMTNMLYPPNPDGNNRALQNFNERKLGFFDAVKNGYAVAEKKENKLGHYERVEKKVHTFIYLPSDKPSGIKDSFVVSEEEAKGIASKKGTLLA